MEVILWCHYKFSSLCYPKGNSRIGMIHNFLKTCVRKHDVSRKEWDKLLPLATSANNKSYSWVSRDQLYNKVFWKDTNTPLNSMLKPQLCYAGDSKFPHLITSMRETWSQAAHNNQLARKARQKIWQLCQNSHSSGWWHGLLKEPYTKQWKPKWLTDF